MSVIIQYVATYAPYIYAVCGLFALVQIYRLWQVRAERRQAVFTLEREKAVRELYNIFSIAMLLLTTMGVTYFFSTTLASAVGEGDEPSVELFPTPVAFIMPTLAPTPVPTPAIVVVATSAAAPSPTEPTPTPTTIVTIVPTVAPTSPPAPVVQAPQCPDSRAVIVRPGNNEVLSGVTNIVGTATHEQFNFYKVEYAPVGTENFVYLGGGNSGMVNGVLVTFDTAALGNGAWTLRLTVVDQTSNFPLPCQVTVQIQN